MEKTKSTKSGLKRVQALIEPELRALAKAKAATEDMFLEDWIARAIKRDLGLEPREPA